MDAAECIGCGARVAACPNSAAMLFVAARVSHLGLLPQGQPERSRRARSMVAALTNALLSASQRAVKNSREVTRPLAAACDRCRDPPCSRRGHPAAATRQNEMTGGPANNVPAPAMKARRCSVCMCGPRYASRLVHRS